MLGLEASEDGDLIRRSASGDREAFVAVARRHGPAVHRLCAAVLGNDADASDATQEALLVAFRRASTYRAERGPVRPWLLAIARREAYRLRPRGHEAPITDEAPLGALGVRAGWSAEDPEALLARAEDVEALARAIAALDPKDREVLVLRDLEGQSGEQAALVLGVDLAAMKSRLHRARLKLMAALREGSTSMAEQERTAGGLRCGQVLELLSDYVDGELSPSVRAQVDEHLKGCVVCERFGGRFGRTIAGLRRGLEQRPAIDPEAFEAVLAHLRR
ncbi:MAG: sigma-70 family RNA polymerase sigma factor [Myxococcaceae bacterium]|nr:sigma-70 family RNA polymerase sigma factor [Myxococcaceae bacterium]